MMHPFNGTRLKRCFTNEMKHCKTFVNIRKQNHVKNKCCSMHKTNQYLQMYQHTFNRKELILKYFMIFKECVEIVYINLISRHGNKNAISSSEQIQTIKTKNRLQNLMYKQKLSMFPIHKVSLQFVFRIIVNAGNVRINTQKGNKIPNDQHPLVQILKRNSFFFVKHKNV